MAGRFCARMPHNQTMNVDHRDRARRTPLHYAVNDHPHTADYFAVRDDPARKAEATEWQIDYRLTNSRRLIDAGADVNARDDAGYTPLHIAVGHDGTEIVRLLLDAGAEVDPLNDKGETPLRVAAQATWSVPETLRLLLDRGADPYVKDNKDHSAIDFVRKYGKPEERAIFGVE